MCRLCAIYGYSYVTLRALFLFFQGLLQFNIIGEPPSPDFFAIANDTGIITIKKNLMTDYSPYYIVRGRKSQRGFPSSINSFVHSLICSFSFLLVIHSFIQQLIQLCFNLCIRALNMLSISGSFLSAFVNKLVPCTWILSDALEIFIFRLRFRISVQSSRAFECV